MKQNIEVMIFLKNLKSEFWTQLAPGIPSSILSANYILFVLLLKYILLHQSLNFNPTHNGDMGIKLGDWIFSCKILILEHIEKRLNLLFWKLSELTEFLRVEGGQALN